MKLRNWTNQPVIPDAIVVPYSEQTALAGFTVRGNGRSYGDAGLNDHVIDMTGHREKIELTENGLRISSGFLLKDILEFCVRNGRFFPVIPGTQFVTVGGMIAADVHGKNHPVNGTVGHWVRSITLKLPDGTVKICSIENEPDLFRATIGGMGMTGVILEAEFCVEPLKGVSMRQQAFAFDQFSGLLNALKADTKPFSVGWVDFFNERHNLLLTADFHPFPKNLNVAEFRLSKPRLTVPDTGVNWISSGLMKWYSARYFRKTVQQPESIISLESYFFPLDKLHYWNRLYGRKGFSQYQFVIPETNAENVFKQIFETIRSSGLKPYLGVLKKHGEMASPGLISFPLMGFSLAIDFPASPQMPVLARELDVIVANSGGRIYLAKDALLDAATFDRMYLNSSEFKAFLKTINPGIMNSLMGKRLKLAGS